MSLVTNPNAEIVAPADEYPGAVTFGPGDDDSEFGVDGSNSDSGVEPEVEAQDEELLAEPGPEYHTALPPKMEAWRRRAVSTFACVTMLAVFVSC